MNKQVSYKTVSLTFGILVACFVIGFYVLAWTEPTEAPPGGNVPTPINVGDIGQSKLGALNIKGGFESEGVTLLATVAGNVGIGTTITSQELDLIGDMELENTTDDDTGVIYKGADRFIHNFQHPTGGGAIPAGYNTFIGVNAGNFTMGSTATQTFHGSNNTALGSYSLYLNTTGNRNTASGYRSLYSNTTGSRNTASGYRSLCSNTTGSRNTASGYLSLYANTIGYQNTALGHNSLYSNTTGGANTALGYNSLYSNTTGYHNIALGYFSGGHTASGLSNQTSNNSVYLGHDTRALASGDTNEIVIGASAIGLGSNTAVLGNSSITKTALRGNVGIGTTNPGTNRLEVVGGPTKTTGGLIIETRTSDPASPETGRMWLRTDL